MRYSNWVFTLNVDIEMKCVSTKTAAHSRLPTPSFKNVHLEDVGISGGIGRALDRVAVGDVTSPCTHLDGRLQRTCKKMAWAAPSGPLPSGFGTHTTVRTITSQNCEAVPRRARISGSWTFASLNSMLESSNEEEGKTEENHAQNPDMA